MGSPAERGSAEGGPEEVAAKLGVPPEDLEAFAELLAAMREAGCATEARLRDWRRHLGQARAAASVRAHIRQHAAEIDAALGDAAEGEGAGAAKLRRLVEQRLLFAGVYGAAQPLDESLRRVLGEAAQHAELRRGRAADGAPPLELRLEGGVFDARHAAIRRGAYPYAPACSARPGDEVLNCLCSDGSLAGYLAMQGSYADDLSVDPRFHGCGVAKSLVVGMAGRLRQQGYEEMSLDVRAMNLPAFELYRHLGFKVEAKRYPSYYDWHGGYRMVARLDEISS